MIPKDLINEWREQAPWRLDAHVEQDLAISRALVEMYTKPNLHEKSSDSDFRDDTEALLSPSIQWDFDDAMRRILGEVVTKLPGEPWKGERGTG